MSEIEKHILPNKEFSLPSVTKVDCTHIPNNHHCDHVLFNACAGHSPQHVRRQASEDTVGQNQSKDSLLYYITDYITYCSLHCVQRDIVKEVLIERGITRGTSKWVHSGTNSKS